MKWCCYIFTGSSLSRLIICFLVLFWEVPSNTIPPFRKMSLYSRGARMTFQKNSYGSRPECPLRFLFSCCLAKLVHFCLGGATLHPLPPNCGQVLRCQYQSPYRPNGAAASPDTQKKEKAKNSCPAVFLLLYKRNAAHIATQWHGFIGLLKIDLATSDVFIRACLSKAAQRVFTWTCNLLLSSFV